MLLIIVESHSIPSAPIVDMLSSLLHVFQDDLVCDRERQLFKHRKMIGERRLQLVERSLRHQ